jgi:hypothetical protein
MSVLPAFGITGVVDDILLVDDDAIVSAIRCLDR